MTKPGNWGNWATIEYKKAKNKKHKKISCRMCVSFSTHDNICKHTEYSDEQESWKTCAKFYFKPTYDTAEYWNMLSKEKLICNDLCQEAT